MPNRTYSLSSGSKYRFGFNGQEKDNEIYGEGNTYDFGARIYDVRIGRWFSIDPLWCKNVGKSPYNFAENSPLRNIDLYGLDAFNVIIEVVNAIKRESIVKVVRDNNIKYGVVAVTFLNGNGSYTEYLSWKRLKYTRVGDIELPYQRLHTNSSTYDDNFASNSNKDFDNKIIKDGYEIGKPIKYQPIATSTIDVNGQKFKFEVEASKQEIVTSISKIAILTTYHPESEFVAKVKADFEKLGYTVKVQAHPDLKAGKIPKVEVLTITLIYDAKTVKVSESIDQVKSVTNLESGEKIVTPTPEVK